MTKRTAPTYGSMQFWPKKRADKFLHSVNWKAIALPTSKNSKVLGFIGYKVGMKTAIVKDSTPNSMTLNKRIAIPVTIISCPHMKIFSIRFYKDGQVVDEVVNEKLDKEIKRVVKMPKKFKKIEDVKKEYDDVRVIAYSVAKETGIKKTPDMIEIGIGGTKEQQLEFAKNNLGKELSVGNFFDKMETVDIRGLTKGYGLCGPVKRYGISLKSHKSEKGQRRPGSLGPWHPNYVAINAKLAGQVGMFPRIIYNNKIIDVINSSENNPTNIKHFGNVRTDYILVKGSVCGTPKRQLLITVGRRKNKASEKTKFDLIEVA